MNYPETKKVVVVEGGLVPVFAMYQIVMFDICPKLETIEARNISTKVFYHRNTSKMIFHASLNHKIIARWIKNNDGEIRWSDVIVQGDPIEGEGRVSLDPDDLGPEDFETKEKILEKMSTPESSISVNLWPLNI